MVQKAGCIYFEIVRFGSLFKESQKNGLTRPKRVRGSGLPMVNMGELFSSPRIKDMKMDFVPVSEKEYKYILQTGDLLFARQSLVLSGAGQCSIFLGNSLPTVFESHLIRCRLDVSRYDPLFYFYFFWSPEGRKAMDSIVEQGAGASGIRGSDLINILVPYPLLPIQKEIAAILSSLDDRITLLRETNKTLEAIAQALFKSWFIDFDPVRAKMENKIPEGMDEETAALFPDSLEKSELGMIPKGWKVGTLGELSKLNPESWTKKSHPDTIVYIDLANAKNNEIAEAMKLSFNEAPSRARRVLRTGDTIIGTVRPGNRSFAFIHKPDEHLTGSTGFAVLRPLTVENTEFVYLTVTQDENIEYLAHIADGGAYPAVRPDVILGLQCAIPDGLVLENFHNIAKPLFSNIATNQKQAQTLATLRDTLLPRLISGKIRVGDLKV